MRWVPLLLISLIFVAGSAHAEVWVDSSVSKTSLVGEHVKGTVVWRISDADARALNRILEQKYDVNHDGYIDMQEAVHYMDALLHKLCGHMVGSAMVSQAYPLHGWDHGALNSEDVRGIMGHLNSTLMIIQVGFVGHTAKNGTLNSMFLAELPFSSGGAVNYTVNPESVHVVHSEFFMGQRGYVPAGGSLIFRLVLGWYFYYSGPVPQNEEIIAQSTPFWDYPLFLFLFLLISSGVANVLFRKMAQYRQYPIGRRSFVMRIILLGLYFPYSLSIFYIPGWLYMLFCVAYVFLVFLMLTTPARESYTERSSDSFAVYVFSMDGVPIYPEEARVPEFPRDMSAGEERILLINGREFSLVAGEHILILFPADELLDGDKAYRLVFEIDSLWKNGEDGQRSAEVKRLVDKFLDTHDIVKNK